MHRVRDGVVEMTMIVSVLCAKTDGCGFSVILNWYS